MYYVFSGDNYYPGGGGNDFVGFSEDLNEAISLATTKLGRGRWAQVCGTGDVKGLVVEWEKWEG